MLPMYNLQSFENAFEVMSTSVEMAWSSMFVIGTRSPMLLAAARNPLDADIEELGRMVPEKIAGFSLAAIALAQALAVAQVGGRADWMTIWLKVMAPLHARVTSNARRLRRRA